MNDLAQSTVSDAIERMLAIWRRILDHDEFGTSDSFFDVGGHSLLTTELAIEVENEFGVPIPVHAIFDHQTVSALCTFIENHRQS
ncbi:acyl carrier protein [Burkholderia anthina]|uniref:acyl carrier protein n=1 Tax=Burkholderia anthina TaxID=179879 RepID=UPI001CF354B5|nr:acyl carrier protein [Burkholderia anthina]MCA8095442.1 acyl carrier protein [Burkholderia anthina]